MHQKKIVSHKRPGFTLLELLIVIGILAILSAVVIFVLNPAETLRKSRDAQRISDLSTAKSALALYLVNTGTPLLDNVANNTCKNGTGVKTMYYSYPNDAPGAPITDVLFDGGTATAAGQVASADLGKLGPAGVGSAGWLPVNLRDLAAGGSPISNMPIDPTNDITTGGSTAAAVTSGALVYRYMCDKNDLTFEIDAQLESTAYTTNPDNKLTKDGGNNPNLYEVGTKLTILGAGTDL